MFRLGYTKPLVLFPNETWALTKKNRGGTRCVQKENA